MASFPEPEKIAVAARLMRKALSSQPDRLAAVDAAVAQCEAALAGLSPDERRAAFATLMDRLHEELFG